MFAKRSLLGLAALSLLSVALALDCNIPRTLTVTNFSEKESSPGRSTKISFIITSPDIGTTCGAVVPGINTVAVNGPCDDGGVWSIVGPEGVLSVSLPFDCPPGVNATLGASGKIPLCAFDVQPCSFELDVDSE
ncbi:hypothetical protein EXIGLDRAFT_747733 [Exidia glandulosa HHB12029]|uniref:Uncharacterized protein n=1 Tax=Exidia glandulosa HHB12029 TaxID=1314781 RepID=A0A166AYD3_EXIGL|nr:hypothetical protein EXIGLDRAFT_747733 [Exidia glandulosa HHB12029]